MSREGPDDRRRRPRLGTQAPAAPPWRDPKRHLWLLGMVIPLLGVAAWGLVEATGWRGFWWFGPMFVFGLIPLIDLLVGRDAENPPEDALAWLEEDRYYRWITYLFLPVQYATLVWGCWALTSFGLPLVDRIGLAVTLGCIAGIGINTAHELGHKREQHEKWLAKVALAQPFYGHFFIEHNRGHHTRVATPEDPASARLGEVVYEFWPRSVVGSLRNAWRLERVRLTRKDGTVWTIRNDVLNAWLMSVVLWGGLLRRVRPGPAAVPGGAGGCRRPAAGERELPGALRPAAGPGRPAAGTRRSTRRTRGTATTSRRTCCSTTCSGTATTTRTRCGATSRCATSPSRRCCPPATRA